LRAEKRCANLESHCKEAARSASAWALFLPALFSSARFSFDRRALLCSRRAEEPNSRARIRASSIFRETLIRQKMAFINANLPYSNRMAKSGRDGLFIALLLPENLWFRSSKPEGVFFNHQRMLVSSQNGTFQILFRLKSACAEEPNSRARIRASSIFRETLIRQKMAFINANLPYSNRMAKSGRDGLFIALLLPENLWFRSSKPEGVFNHKRMLVSSQNGTFQILFRLKSALVQKSRTASFERF